jgi:predicted negative regulator of RcsB-dependent stress response
MHAFAAQLDDIGKPAGIALTVVSFILFWPLGLLVLGFLIGSGRMACWKHGGTDRWQRRMERMQGAAERWGCANNRTSSGNRAFDEYRAETLRRLEEEQREFMAFLDRLRQAKDKVEFDQFMAEHRRPSNGPQPQTV